MSQMDDAEMLKILANRTLLSPLDLIAKTSSSVSFAVPESLLFLFKNTEASRYIIPKTTNRMR